MTFDREEDENPEAGTPQVDPEVEREAREMGWAPRESWRGKPEDFVDAAEFVDRGRRILPVVRAQFDKARAENERLKKELADRTAHFERQLGETSAQMEARLAERASEFEKRIRANEAMSRRSLDLQRAQIVADYEAQKRTAAANGDTEAYDQIARREQETYRRLAEEERTLIQTPQHAPEPTRASQAPVSAPADNRPQSQQPAIPPEVKAFSDRNPWFMDNALMRQAAIDAHDELSRESPYMSLKDNLEEVERRVKEQFPSKFGLQRPKAEAAQAATRQPAKQGYQAVEGGGISRASSAPKTPGFKELPPEAKTACDELIQKGLLKGEKARDNYARQYWAEYGE